jgi:hypothetical protein
LPLSSHLAISLRSKLYRCGVNSTTVACGSSPYAEGGDVRTADHNQAVKFLQVSLKDNFVVDGRQYHRGAAIFRHSPHVCEIHVHLLCGRILIRSVDARNPYQRS